MRGRFLVNTVATINDLDLTYPFIGTLYIIARDHLSKADLLADAIRLLIGNRSAAHRAMHLALAFVITIATLGTKHHDVQQAASTLTGIGSHLSIIGNGGRIAIVCTARGLSGSRTGASMVATSGSRGIVVGTVVVIMVTL